MNGFFFSEAFGEDYQGMTMRSDGVQDGFGQWTWHQQERRPCVSASCQI